MDIRDIQNLIKFVSKAGVNEVKLETKDFKISIKTAPDYNGAPIVSNAPQYIQPAQTTFETPMATPVKEAAVVDENANYVTINSPMIGTFYRRPSPDKPMFANVGDSVSIGSVVCIIEAMKLFNEIESEVSGKIVKILVDDSSPVEFGQPLFLVDPS
ncbi:MAG: acetyl-CoA carboxylase biotin carboxyl carrier protein [Flavobacteriaceae bacterium]|nr:acetyl-CoA carboxylase biotin carboxyl carrier protein [Flavobacteriaceae bacterium]